MPISRITLRHRSRSEFSPVAGTYFDLEPAHFQAKDSPGSKRSAPNEHFSWPLQAGKEWRTFFVRENIEQRSSDKLDYINVNPGIEEVKVTAGNFQAFKIKTYTANNGALVSELWYVPDVKWFVKAREYLRDGVREEELTSFKFD